MCSLLQEGDEIATRKAAPTKSDLQHVGRIDGGKQKAMRGVRKEENKPVDEHNRSRLALCRVLSKAAEGKEAA